MKNLMLFLVGISFVALAGCKESTEISTADSGDNLNNISKNQYKYDEALDLCVNDQGLEGFNLEIGECANLMNLDLSNRDFSGLNLRGTNFSGSNLAGAVFDEADLLGAIFDHNFQLPVELAEDEAEESAPEESEGEVEEVVGVDVEAEDESSLPFVVKDELDALRIEVKELKSARQPYKEMIVEARAEIKDIRQRYVQPINGKIADLKKDAKVLSAQIKEAKKLGDFVLIESLRIDRKNLKEKIVKLKAERKPYLSDVNQLRAKIREMRNPLIEINGKIQIIRIEIQELKLV